MTGVQPTLNRHILQPGIHSPALRVRARTHAVTHQSLGDITQTIAGITQTHPQPPILSAGHELVTAQLLHSTFHERHGRVINRVARIHRAEQTRRINNRLASRLHRSIALIHLKHGRAQHRVAALHQGRNQTRKTSRLRQIIRISTSNQLIRTRLQTGVQRLRQTNILSQLHHLNRRAIQILGALNPAVHHGIQLGGQRAVLHQNQLRRTHRLVQQVRLQSLIQIGGVLLRVHAHQHRKIGYRAHATARLLRISEAFSGCRHSVAARESQRVNTLKHLSIRTRRTQAITHTIEEVPQVGPAVISTQNSRNPQARRRTTIE